MHDIFPKLCVGLMLFHAVLAGAHAADQGLAPVTPRYAKHDAFLCAPAKISIDTQCEEKEQDLPYCHTQSVQFDAHGTKTAVVYKYQFNRGNQQFITTGECYRKNDTSYVVLSSTNFGNCSVCEWADVFTPQGKYLGSTAGMFDDANFKHLSGTKAVDDFLNDLFKQDNYHVSAEKHILRTR
ncbi:hypothetical protein GTP55_13405 [Duganella sp. FT109W]|uniref:Uncharacterized protein n=1 Tax=Duganella margarita TaxID=2692170 RepID=A0ABW9WHG5_9BURK|nr:hypothetical protein [Duganella margarita]MYN40373.1 hypothetical protein [Duganella margarita]